MKTGKLALLATLTAALAFGGMAPVGAVEEPLTPPATVDVPEVPTDGLAGAHLHGFDPQPSDQPVPGAIPDGNAEPPASSLDQSAGTNVEDYSPPIATSVEPVQPLGEDEGYDPVVGGGFPVPGPNTPLVTDPDGTVRSAVETDIAALHDHHGASFSSRDGGASINGGAARAGTIQVTLVYATLTDNRSDVDRDPAWLSILRANEYWRGASNDRLGMEIASAFPFNSTANSRMDYATMMNRIKQDLGWRDRPYTALVAYVPELELHSGGYGGILGGGWTTGGTGGTVIMPRPSGFSNNVVTHELGHVLGLLHANSLRCNNGRSDIWIGSNGQWADGQCSSREYGDTSDLMGYAQHSLPLINSYFWDTGAFGRGDEIVDAGTPGMPKTYTLRAWAGTSARRAVKFRDTSGETYYVELRLPVGYDANTAIGGNRGVKIIKADLANNWAVNSLLLSPNTRDFPGYTNANSTWQAGQTFTAHTNTTVRINSVSGDSASVTITGGATAQAFTPIADMRAANSWLGEATSSVTGGLAAGGAFQSFRNGVILWSPSTGARISSGAIRSFYATVGYQDGFLGYPTSNEYAVAGGAIQDYQGGRIVWSPQLGSSYVLGAIGATYMSKGGPSGPLGFPVGNEWSLSRGVVQAFQNGAIYWTPTTGAHVLGGAIQTQYGSQGYETGFLGYPTSDERPVAGGAIQSFEGGAIAWSPQTGANFLFRGMETAFHNSGGPAGPLGFPTGPELGLPTRSGAKQTFQNGVLYWSARTGGVAVLDGEIGRFYTRLGAETSFLGYPLSPAIAANGGSSQAFEGGRLTWTREFGVQTVYSGMNVAYAQLGGPTGSLGYPTSGEIATSRGGAVQSFERGKIYWSPSVGNAALMNGPLLDAFIAAGAERALGHPTSAGLSTAGGTVQRFEYGRIAWSPATGAHFLFGAIDMAYESARGPAGPYGFPTGNEAAITGRPGVQQQAFQFGSMYWSESTGAHFIGGAIKSEYDALGKEMSFLGLPITNERPSGNGVVQDFQGGSMFWSSATGAVAAYGAIRDTYLALGGSSGRLGFPLDMEKNLGNRTQQQFQGGTLQWSASGGTTVSWK